MFGISGAHRAGKSTLAREILSKSTTVDFVDISATRLMREGGFDPIAPMTMSQRLDAQEYALDRIKEILDDSPGLFITDRTPLDYAAYTLAEVGMLNVDDTRLQDRVLAYVDKCQGLTRQYFNLVFVLRPLAEYEMKDGKPPKNLAYQQHIQLLIEGQLYGLGNYVSQVVISSSDLEVRLGIAAKEINDAMGRLASARGKIEAMNLMN